MFEISTPWKISLPLCLTLSLLLGIPGAKAQKLLQMERAGSYKTQKIYIGEEITYRLHGDDYWYHSAIRDLLVDEKIIVFHDRYVHMDSIAAFRWDRNGMRAIGKQLFWFGLGWSGYAAIGTVTDGNPESNYRWSDAIVTGGSWLLSLIAPKMFRYKKRKFGKRRRLRMLDLTPVNVENEPRP
jgi:hypothetical protein